MDKIKLKIISDGTNLGTKIIDEETGTQVSNIKKITWKADYERSITTAIIEFFNLPVEITSSAKVNLMTYTQDNGWEKPLLSKTFDKEIKIVSENKDTENTTFQKTLILDAKTQSPVGCIQKIEWEATPEKRDALLEKICFDNKDWL